MLLMMNPDSKLLIRLCGTLLLVFGSTSLAAQADIDATGGAQEIETVTVDKSFNNREIKVRIGAAIRVNLEELGAAGYQWEIKDFEKESFEILSVETRSKTSTVAIEGAPVLKTWLIRPRKQGKSELKFIHYRSWEGAKNASDTFNLKVRVVP